MVIKDRNASKNSSNTMEESWFPRSRRIQESAFRSKMTERSVPLDARHDGRAIQPTCHSAVGKGFAKSASVRRHRLLNRIQTGFSNAAITYGRILLVRRAEWKDMTNCFLSTISSSWSARDPTETCSTAIGKRITRRLH